MSDNRQWQAPGTDSAEAGAVNGAGEQIPPTRTGWSPPPKPGLIPLRPLELGTLLGASFRLFRRNPRPTFGVALLIQGIVTPVSLAIVGIVSYFAFSRVDFASATAQPAVIAGAYGMVGLSAIVPLLLSLVASALLQGIIVLEVSRATLGEKQILRQLRARGRGRFGRLVGYTLLVALATGIAVALIVGLIVLFVATLGTVGIVIGIILGVFATLALIVGVYWIGTKLSLVPSALMLERLTIRQAIRRSWTLTHGYFWKTFGIELLVAAMLGIATQVISAPLSVLGPVLINLTDPNGQKGAVTMIVLGGIAVLAVIISVVFGAISGVVESAATALIYLDLRMRKEGLDLELARFVEAQQAGDTTVADPYLPLA